MRSLPHLRSLSIAHWLPRWLVDRGLAPSVYSPNADFAWCLWTRPFVQARHRGSVLRAATLTVAMAAISALPGCGRQCACSPQQPQPYYPATPYRNPAFANERAVPQGAPVPRGGGRAVIGDPYSYDGVVFTPHADPTYDTEGAAAWMADSYHGRRTANGEIHDSTALVGAHPTLPLPSYVMVTNLANGRQLILRINDRGPFNRGRILDASHRAAYILGYAAAGTTRVRVQYLGPAPLSGDPSYEEGFLARQTAGRCRTSAAPAYDCPPYYSPGYAQGY